MKELRNMWPVLSRDGRGVSVDPREVIYLEREGNDLIYHTRREEYRHIPPETKIKTIADAFKLMGFENLFQSNIVNMSAIKYFDPELRLLYFEDDLDNSKKVTVRRESVTIVNKFLGNNPNLDNGYH